MTTKKVEIVQIVNEGEEYSLSFNEPLTTDRIEDVDEEISATYVTILPQKETKAPKIAAEKLAILKIPAYRTAPTTVNGLPFPSHYNDEHLIAVPYDKAESIIASMQVKLDAAIE